MNPSVQAIIAAAAHYFHQTPAELTGRGRSLSLIRSRQIAMYVARTQTRLSLAEIGYRIGDRDHTTILHGVRTVAARMATEDTWAADVRQILAELKQAEAACQPS